MIKFKITNTNNTCEITNLKTFRRVTKRGVRRKIIIGSLIISGILLSTNLLLPIDVVATEDYTVIEVQAGDTLDAIASVYGCTYEEIAKYNSIENPDNIEVGQKIKIPIIENKTTKVDLESWDSKLAEDGFVKGIDISLYQNEMDLESVLKNNDINAVIARAAYFWGIDDLENYECDDCLDKFATVSRDCYVAFGIYYFPTLANIERTEKEVNIILEKLKDLESKNIYCTLPIFFDIEASVDGGGDLVERLGNREPEAVKCFNHAINLFRENGYEVMMYTNSNCCSNYGFEELAQESNIKLWLAQYPTTDSVNIETNPRKEYEGYFESSRPHSIRQYSDNGRVNGYDQQLDLDLFYENIPQYIIENELNHTYKMEQPKKAKSKIFKIFDNLHK